MRFVSVAERLGIQHRYTDPDSSVFILPMLGGIAAGDFNRDGLDDLFVLGGGSAPDQLLIASMEGGELSFTDRAAEWGVGVAHIGAGVSVADYDADGYLDVYVTSHGDSTGERDGAHKLYRNSGPDEHGVFSFEDVALAAGVNRTTEVRVDGYSSAWGDIDLDGDLDLFVTGWVAASGGNRLFANNGDGTFTDVSSEALPATVARVRGFTPRFVDLTGDTFPEILIAADHGTSVLYRNDGTGRFTDVTVPSGTSRESNGMGATTADFNNDGLIDWYVTSIMNDFTDQNGNTFYLNRGTFGGVPVFAETAAQAGVDDGGWGWGAASGDLDLDGDIDIVETNGWSGGQWTIERAYLFLNEGDGTAFTEDGLRCGLGFDAQGRGILLWDMDRDGDLDLALPAIDAPTGIYRNDRDRRDPASWLALRLDSSSSPSIAPDGVGARIAVSAGGRVYHRWVQANSDYLSQPPIGAHFGLAGATSIDAVTVEWPNGSKRVLTDLGPNRSYTIHSCDADTTADGLVTPEDVPRFIDAFLRGDRSADLRPDRRLDFFDIAAFLDAYAAGCTPVEPDSPEHTPTLGQTRGPAP